MTQQLTPELAREHLRRLEERRNEVEQAMIAQLEREVEQKREMAKFLERLDKAKRDKKDE